MQDPKSFILPLVGPSQQYDMLTKENEASFTAGWNTVTLTTGMVRYRFTGGRYAWAFSDQYAVVNVNAGLLRKRY